jgi:2-phospho-L-lactate transferase/gluconeogenesis factor (CofD/UPF0052 family)
VLVTLCGGVGAARMLSGWSASCPPGDITAIVNVGDDMVLHGLHISPDLDTVTYTLAGMDNRETGWGLAGESWTVMDELAQLGGESWFRLGDRDLATHLFRTERLHCLPIQPDRLHWPPAFRARSPRHSDGATPRCHRGLAHRRRSSPQGAG